MSPTPPPPVFPYGPRIPHTVQPQLNLCVFVECAPVLLIFDSFHEAPAASADVQQQVKSSIYSSARSVKLLLYLVACWLDP